VDLRRIQLASFFILYTDWQEFLLPHVLQRSAAITNHSLWFEKILTSPLNSSSTIMNLAKIMSWSGMQVEDETTRALYETICFVELLDEVRRCKATDPRDKIYGVLGILALTKTPFTDMGAHAESRLKAYVEVDYQVPVKMVHARTVRAIIAESRSLHVWERREGNPYRKQRNLPSWVPDFSTAKNPPLLPRSSFYKADRHLPWEERAVRQTGNKLLLPVRGIRVGKVADITPSVTELNGAGGPALYGKICGVASGLPELYLRG